MPPRQLPWPHAPEHRLEAAGAYFVTAATYRKEHHFRGARRLEVLHRGLLTVARRHGWHLEAWAVFSNHYHFVACSPLGAETAASLRKMLSELHVKTAKWINRLDAVPGRKVWYNYRETHLSFESSYFARLAYTHRNPTRHGLVAVARQYPWCSAGWFERVATPAQVKTVYGFGEDFLRIPDDFDVDPEWWGAFSSKGITRVKANSESARMPKCATATARFRGTDLEAVECAGRKSAVNP